MLIRKFGRNVGSRQSLIRNLATSLILYEKVITTAPKAKEVRAVVEKWINIGKKDGLFSYRRLRAQVLDPKAAQKIVEELAPRYKNIQGGYVVTIPLFPRKGDRAPMAIMELRPISATVFPPEVAVPAGKVKAAKETVKATRKRKLTTQATKKSASSSKKSGRKKRS